MKLRPRMCRVLGLVCLLALIGPGCADVATVEPETITPAPDATPPPVPTLPADGGAVEAAPGGPTEPVAAPTGADPAATAPPAETPSEVEGAEDAGPQGDPLADVPADPEAFGRSLGLSGLIELLDADPDRVGERGKDLVTELERVADKPDERRVERARERIEEWMADEELDAAIGRAALAAIETGTS